MFDCGLFAWCVVVVFVLCVFVSLLFCVFVLRVFVELFCFVLVYVCVC